MYYYYYETLFPTAEHGIRTIPEDGTEVILSLSAPALHTSVHPLPVSSIYVYL